MAKTLSTVSAFESHPGSMNTARESSNMHERAGRRSESDNDVQQRRGRSSSNGDPDKRGTTNGSLHKLLSEEKARLEKQLDYQKKYSRKLERALGKIISSNPQLKSSLQEAGQMIREGDTELQTAQAKLATLQNELEELKLIVLDERDKNDLLTKEVQQKQATIQQKDLSLHNIQIQLTSYEEVYFFASNLKKGYPKDDK
eukprot:TRINITY_DN3700_c0_g1_i1.p1 TRINITY_DN3700_c0_g1~~TRINITY_DN3700_c0_g1_i1.p1  ORF type:complete len:200 (-),score=45.66 TRINITY_DN3700_c0_g1_i1:518-1117(-)